METGSLIEGRESNQQFWKSCNLPSEIFVHQRIHMIKVVSKFCTHQ